MSNQNESREAAKQLFSLIQGKIGALRVEIELLEAEGNGLREIAESIVSKLSSTPIFIDPTVASDANAVVNQKWSEQAQRYSSQANTIAKILLDKSKQMLDLVQFLKSKLKDLGYDIPDDGADFFDWDEILFEKEAPAFD